MFDQQLTFVKKQFQTKIEAIDFLIQKAIESKKVIGGEAYKQSVCQREEEFSTAVGYDIAIPHGSSQDVQESFVAVATLEAPLHWGDELVKMIFLIGVPENKRTKEHLQILAWLSRNLMHQEFREDILHAENEQQLFNCLKKLETEKGD